MAMVKCAECGKEVSDQAVTCPSCGAPIAGVQVTRQEKEFSVRQGAITGFIGAIAYPIIFGVLWAINNAAPKEEATPVVIVSPSGGSWIVGLPVLIGLVVALVCFVIGIAFGNKLSRTQSLVLSVTGLIASVTVFICIMAVYSAIMLCVGAAFGWEPVLMTWGAVKMLKSSLRMPK